MLVESSTLNESPSYSPRGVESPVSPEGERGGVDSPEGAGGQAAASDDDADVIFAGTINRKHALKAGGQKASERSWIQSFAVLRASGRLCAYRDEKAYRSVCVNRFPTVFPLLPLVNKNSPRFSVAQHPNRFQRGEEPIEVLGGEISRVQHHSKAHVFQLTRDDGSAYLFQTKTDVS